MKTWYQVWYLDNGIAKVFGFSISGDYVMSTFYTGWELITLKDI